ncbi:hypothetical protein BKA67DRAFT_569594, partial [Truncatella angustata]
KTRLLYSLLDYLLRLCIGSVILSRLPNRVSARINRFVASTTDRLQRPSSLAGTQEWTSATPVKVPARITSGRQHVSKKSGRFRLYSLCLGSGSGREMRKTITSHASQSPTRVAAHSWDPKEQKTERD